MATDAAAGWRPDWAVPPGEILLETLQERGITQSELARRMGRPIKTINEIVRGKAALTPDTAIQLELTLGIPARFWNNLELVYRERLARDKAQEELQENVDWADRFPLKDLLRHELISKPTNDADRVASVLTYFGVSSPDTWRQKWLGRSVAFRSSPSFRSAPEAVAAWLRWGELEAQKMELSPFSKHEFLATLVEVRQLTRKPLFSPLIDVLRNICARHGVALLLTPEFRGTSLSGAARWLSTDWALIQLSLRYKSDDEFWFTFFHEVGHVLEPDGKRDFLDEANGRSTDDRLERKADQFARDCLISPDSYAEFARTRRFTTTSVRTFAQKVGVAPGIVVGRLQHEGLLPRSHLNDLKRPVHFTTPGKRSRQND